MNYKKVITNNLDCSENLLYYDLDTDINSFLKKLRFQIENNHKQIYINLRYYGDSNFYDDDIKNIFKNEIINNEDIDKKKIINNKILHYKLEVLISCNNNFFYVLMHLKNLIVLIQN